MAAEEFEDTGHFKIRRIDKADDDERHELLEVLMSAVLALMTKHELTVFEHELSTLVPDTVMRISIDDNIIKVTRDMRDEPRSVQ